ncbi:MAG: formylglycine-generating enzyme family protein [Thermodesulfobacteriota bacterium]
MKKLSFPAFTLLIFFSFLLFSTAATAAEKAPEAEQKNVSKKDSKKKHAPLSDKPLTREERIKIFQAKKKKEYEDRKKNMPPIKMIYVKGGCFNMGDFTGKGDDDEVPVHEVCLSDYYIGEVEVTNSLWEHVMGWTYAEDLDPKMPLVNVTWGWANDFIANLNKLTDGFYRLPTEAEWEFAARERGKNIRWSGTNSDENLGDFAWFLYNSDGELHHGKEKKPNALGLYDMTGNAWEWVEDNFDFDYYKEGDMEDPYGPDFSSWRTVRGGSSLETPYKVRNTYRYGREPNLRNKMTGFRLAE